MHGRKGSAGVPALRLPLLVCSLAMVLAGQAGAVTVGPADGVTIAQLDVVVGGAVVADSNVGEITIDVAAIRAATGVYTGFVNVQTGQGWVVQNLPVLAKFGEASLSASFKLADQPGTPVPFLLAQIDYSPHPTAAFLGAGTELFSVGERRVEIGGKPGQSGPTAAAPPPPSAVVFDPFGATYVCCQEDHANVEAADDQCGPAAVANSLDWLAWQNFPLFWTLPPNVPGLGGDGSLVGGLETAMGRTFRSRRDGDPLGDREFLEGKLCYLEQRWLAHLLDIKHQDDQFGHVDVTCPGGTATSRGRGRPPTAAFVIEEVCADEDVELGYSWSGGGHWVTGVCAGKILGVPFVLYLSDWDQGDDAKGTGAGSLHFSLLVDTDADGMANLASEDGNPDVDIVVSESPRPEIDRFWWMSATLLIESDWLIDRVDLRGSGVIQADVADVLDRDGDGLDDIPVRLAHLELSGTSQVLGDVTLTLADGGVAAASLPPPDVIEERANEVPGTLDLPPFAPAGTATVLMNVPLQITLGESLMVSGQPGLFGGVVSFKPVAPLESYYLLAPVPLRTPEGLPLAFRIVAAVLTPLPRVEAVARPWINGATFSTGDTLVSDLTLLNPGVQVAADLYYGFQLPDGSLLLVTNLAPLGVFSAPLDAPRRFMPLLADLDMVSGYASYMPRAFSHTFAGWEPLGDYGVVAALVQPGAFQDGRADPGDILALEVQRFTFTGAAAADTRGGEARPGR